ncbi:MAG: ABC transporter substrate-binding protein [Chloroflexi bacterium]|nr:ABC transporter substrate-binding protein [Chloroflexota bacterium]
MSKRILVFASVMVVVALFVAACGQPPPAAPAATQPAPAAQIQRGGDLIMALVTDVGTLNPHLSSNAATMNIFYQGLEPLVWIDPQTKQAKGWLATSWDVSADGKEWTFQLRQGVKFHDGTPFNAAAAKWNFDHLLDPKLQAGAARNFVASVARVEAPAEYTLKLFLKSTDAGLLDSLHYGHIGMICPEAVKQFGDAEFANHFCGTGPYKLKELVAGNHVTFVRNEEYNWAPDWMGHQGPGYLNSITWRFITDDTTRTAVLETGEVNVAVNLPAPDVTRLTANKNLTIMSPMPSGVSQGLYMNVTKWPTDDLVIRQAMAWAADRETFSKVAYFGIWPPTSTTLSPNTLCYSKESEIYRYDPAKAKALLDGAGYKDTNGDGIREKDGKPIKVLFIKEASFLGAELIQSQFRAVGIDVEIQEVSAAGRQDAASKGLHNIMPGGTISGDPSFMNNYFMTGSPLNVAKVSDKELEKLLLDAKAALDVKERCKLFAAVQKRIMENVYHLPLVVSPSTIGTRKEVQGIRFDVTGWFMVLYDTYMQR